MVLSRSLPHSDAASHLIAAIADLHAPHAAGAVDVFVAVGIIDVDALGLGDDHGAIAIFITGFCVQGTLPNS